jgi:hypothetical protein
MHVTYKEIDLQLPLKLWTFLRRLKKIALAIQLGNSSTSNAYNQSL